MAKAKIVVLDIETAPKMALVWGFFKQFISPKQVLARCNIMCFTAKEVGKKGFIYKESRSSDDRELVQALVEVLDEADIVVAHNGKRFDLATIRGRAAVLGIKPPSPYKIVDTLVSAKKEFNFESNSLENLCIEFGCKNKKTSHALFPGFELWLECLSGNEKAWKEMRKYNIQDVYALEELYLKMRPFISDHPNVAVIEEKNEISCPKCGSSNIHFRGYHVTQVSKYRRYQCKEVSCGGWGRTRYNEYPANKRKVLGTNAI